MKKKYCLGFLLFLTTLFFAAAQSRNANPYWFTLERGKLYFRNGSYGDALIAFEDARRQRDSMYSRMERALIDVLSIPEVRRFGDSLDRLESYIAERNQINASEALQELYYRFSRESLNNSCQKALELIGELKHYPEAEYWLGETYFAEGELSLALRQYRRSYELRNYFENPSFGNEVLYRMAGLHRLRQEYNEMEECLLEILAGDTLWSGNSGSFARNAMTRTLENDGINQFLTMYRYTNVQYERAHRLLGFYYYGSGRHNRAADHLLFAFLIQNSVLIEEISAHQFDYSFSDVDALVTEAERRTVPASFMNETEYFKTAYFLGTALYGTGNLTGARYFWSFLSRQASAGEWHDRGLSQMKSPFVEKVVEMP
ncbi:hypothetical protein LJC14_01315 [Treponema sp. OttesenSCG-928-L16]|nr:hypothetical protein [Treponema sp. OttesenSCG-928-L16]